MSHLRTALVVLAAAPFAIGLVGCGTTVDAQNGAQETVAGLAVQGADLGPLAASGEALGLQTPPQLTEEQQAALDALRTQFEAGEITREELHQQLRDILGDLPFGPAFGHGFGPGFHGRHHGHHAGPFAQLNLTDEQRTAAEQIHDNARADIQVLRDAAQEQVRALLTEEQLATFDELRDQAPRHPEGFAMGGFGGPHGHGGRHGPGPGFGHFGPHGFAGGDRLATLTEQLGLTEEQQAQIETIHEELRDAVRTRHDQARDQFRALLTEEQLAIFDQFHPPTDGEE